MTIIPLTFLMFFIMDPIGNVTAFLQVLQNHPAARQRAIIFREMVFALGLMLFFAFLGDHVLWVLELSETTVNLTAGLILFLISLGILFPNQNSLRARMQPEESPFLVPLAVPLIAGPSILATIILYAHIDPTWYLLMGAITMAWAVSLAILLLAPQMLTIFGKNGLRAMEKLIGMVLILLAVQRFMQGVQLFASSYLTHS